MYIIIIVKSSRKREITDNDHQPHQSTHEWSQQLQASNNHNTPLRGAPRTHTVHNENTTNKTACLKQQLTGWLGQKTRSAKQQQQQQQQQQQASSSSSTPNPRTSFSRTNATKKKRHIIIIINAYYLRACATLRPPVRPAFRSRTTA